MAHFGQLSFKIHPCRILGHKFHICDPKPGWNILSWLGARGSCSAFYRGSFGDLIEGNPYSHVWWMFKGFDGLDLTWNWLNWSYLKLIETQMNWFETDLIWFDDICWCLNVGYSKAKLYQNYTQFIFKRKEGGFPIKWCLLTDLDIPHTFSIELWGQVFSIECLLT